MNSAWIWFIGIYYVSLVISLAGIIIRSHFVGRAFDDKFQKKIIICLCIVPVVNAIWAGLIVTIITSALFIRWIEK